MRNINCDIVCINETFLTGNDVLSIPSYKWYGRNRTNKHKRAKRGAGGVGIFVHERVTKYFNVNILDNSIEDVLWLEINAINVDFTICLCVCYLPPKDSSYKVDGEQFFTSLLEQIYSYQNRGYICICGDINARCGLKQDFVEGVDDICERTCIDPEENHYGDLFIDHLIASNMCMLNGRSGLLNDNKYTQISTKGKSVVDYVWVPHEQLQNWSQFKVKTMSEMIDNYNLDVPSSIPDHSILVWNLQLPQDVLRTEFKIVTPHDFKKC